MERGSVAWRALLEFDPRHPLVLPERLEHHPSPLNKEIITPAIAGHHGAVRLQVTNSLITSSNGPSMPENRWSPPRNSTNRAPGMRVAQVASRLDVGRWVLWWSEEIIRRT